MTAPLEPGARLGPYLLQRLLGSGGSADVWEALLEGPGGFQKPVALKLLRPGLDADPLLREALLREARLGARLQHPHLVGTLLLSQVDDRLAIALELVRGPTASELMRRLGGPLPPRALLDLALQAAEALHYIHTFHLDDRPLALVHRDVKPSNLLVDPHGVVKLADLGITVPSGDSGGLAGTPGYLPPEQADGSPEPRSDLFSLGVTLYTLATGRLPFGKGLAAVAEARRVEALLGRPGFLAPLDLALPGLGDLLRDLLRLRPEDRLPSAEALARRLRALVATASPGPSLRGLVLGEPATAAADTPSLGSRATTVVALAGNLQPSRDPFIGRREELDHLASRLDQDRWTVLLGPGGLGKTRLALELARSVQRRFSGGAWAFDLTEARTPEGICAAVAQGLDLPLGGRDPVRQLGHALAAKGPCLVVLDNLEQCVHALPVTLEAWRELAPEVRFLGTSRVRPGLSAEVVVPLSRLPPDDAHLLFRLRAPRALSEGEQGRLPGLCAALDHMPLALELAAARLRILSLQDISDRLSLRLLGGGGQDRPLRHRSVHASLQWSWDLLSPAAQAALLQLSVFEGGFDWAAAEAVLDLGPGAPWALGVLQELADASLLRVDPSSGRFSTWVVVREFASERLAPDPRAAVALRHARHFARLDPRAPGIHQELDNLVAACREALSRGQGELALSALRVASTVFHHRGPYAAWLDLAAAVCRAPLDPTLEIYARVSLAEPLFYAGRPREALAELERARGDLAALEDDRRATLPPEAEGYLWSCLGIAQFTLGRIREATEAMERAVQACRSAGLRRLEGVALGNLGNLHRHQGRMEEARALYDAALAVARELGDRRHEGAVLGNLGILHSLQGNFEESRARYQEALAVARELGLRVSEGIVLGNLGILCRSEGRIDEACAHCRTAVALHREVGDPRSEGLVLGNLASMEELRQESAAARAALERATHLLRQVGDPTSLAWILATRARSEVGGGDREAAVRHLEEARACVAELEVSPASELGQALALAEEVLRRPPP